MERAYIEEDPSSAPHFVPKDLSQEPPAYIGTTIWPPSDGDANTIAQCTSSPLAQKKNKRRLWIIISAVLIVIVIVAAVVGGVVGSRNARETQSSSDNTSNTSSISAASPQTSMATSTQTRATTSTETQTSATPDATVITQPSENDSYFAIVHMYRNDKCSVTDDSFAVLRHNSSTCMKVPSDKTSIQVTQNKGCSIKTWSGGNCRGGAYNVTDLYCHALPYAAVSVEC